MIQIPTEVCPIRNKFSHFYYIYIKAFFATTLAFAIQMPMDKSFQSFPCANYGHAEGRGEERGEKERERKAEKEGGVDTEKTSNNSKLNISNISTKHKWEIRTKCKIQTQAHSHTHLYTPTS